MSPDQVEIIKTAAATLATIITALLVFLGVVVSSRKPSTTKPPNGNTGQALQEFNGTQNEFMALVIADNKDLRQKLDGVESMVSDIKIHQDNFLSAVRRYLIKLATAWPGPESMPWPDDEDFPILEDTLPSRKVRRATLRKESDNGH